VRPSLERAVEDVTTLLDTSSSADLCGLSLGGLVALRAALERPARVRRLVLVAAFARLPPSLRALQLVLAAVARVPPERILERGLLSAVPAPYRGEAKSELELSRGQLARVMREGRASCARAPATT
jgi:pimeloyl-ACP methyl ester carboxylesterase